MSRTIDARRYRKTIGGLLGTIYNNMQLRVTGKASKNNSVYIGLEILSRNEFYSWAKRDIEFNNLFNLWVTSNYCKKLTPSVDRIDSKLGYFLDNMRWLTVSKNSKISDKRKIKRHNHTSKYIGVSRKRNFWRAYYFIDNKQINIGTFKTEKEAALARDEKVKEIYDYPTLNFIK